MVRATYIDKNGLKKGAWTREEDDKLRAYMKRYGPGNWRQMPKFAGLTRCGKSCRLRWMNYLCPGLKHGNYSEEEEDLIIKMHEQLGNKWSEIAAKLPGRTDNDVKNYWHAHLKKRIMDRDRNKYDDNDDLNEQSSHDQEPSQTEMRPTTEVAEAESVLANTPFQPILEGSTLFPQKFPDDEFPLSSPDAAAQIRASASENWNAEGRSLTSFEEFIGDFWTTPFVPDNTYYNQDAYPPIFSWEESSVLPHDASCFDDSLDLFCQVMQEFPGSSS